MYFSTNSWKQILQVHSDMLHNIYVLVSNFSYKKELTLRNKYCVTCRKLNDLYSPKTRFHNFNAFFHSFHIAQSTVRKKDKGKGISVEICYHTMIDLTKNPKVKVLKSLPFIHFSTSEA